MSAVHACISLPDSNPGAAGGVLLLTLCSAVSMILAQASLKKQSITCSDIYLFRLVHEDDPPFQTGRWGIMPK